MITEKGPEYYNRVYSSHYCTRRYHHIYTVAARLCEGRVLDMGCGVGDFRNFLPEGTFYEGFDFAETALSSGLRKGDLYEEPLEGYDTYVLLEVLEHVDDLRVLKRIPAGKRVILSVPSFGDPSHLRSYSLVAAIKRFSAHLDFVGEPFFFADHKSEFKPVPLEPAHGRYIILLQGISRF
jgi:hypothetical protein